MFDLEVFVTKDGVLYFNELNLRKGGLYSILRYSKINLSERMAEAVLKDGRILQPIPPVQYGQICIREMMLNKDCERGYRNLWEVISLYRRAQVKLLYNPKDRGFDLALQRWTAKCFWKACVHKPIKRRIRKLIGKLKKG